MFEGINSADRSERNVEVKKVQRRMEKGTKREK